MGMSNDRIFLLWFLLFALGGAVIADFTTDVWTKRPMVAGLLAGALVLAFTVVLVDEYLRHQARKAWAGVAAFALEDLGRGTRAVWVVYASWIQPPQVPAIQEQFRLQITSVQGRADLQQTLKQRMQNAEDRKALHDKMREIAVRTRELLMAWAPVMTGVPELAEALAKFTRMHRLTVQVLSFLDRDIKGFQIPITTDELAEKVLTIMYLAEELDRVYFKDAGYHEPLYAVAPVP